MSIYLICSKDKMIMYVSHIIKHWVQDYHFDTSIASTMWKWDSNLGLLMLPPNGARQSEGTVPDDKVHGANMGPIWGRQGPMLGLWTWQKI